MGNSCSRGEILVWFIISIAKFHVGFVLSEFLTFGRIRAELVVGYTSGLFPDPGITYARRLAGALFRMFGTLLVSFPSQVFVHGEKPHLLVLISPCLLSLR